MTFTTQGLAQVARLTASVLLAAGILEPLRGWWGGVTVAQLLLATLLSFIAVKRSKWWLLLSGLCIASLAVLIAGVAA